jgi:hypothetical protein
VGGYPELNQALLYGVTAVNRRQLDVALPVHLALSDLQPDDGILFGVTKSEGNPISVKTTWIAVGLSSTPKGVVVYRCDPITHSVSRQTGTGFELPLDSNPINFAGATLRAEVRDGLLALSVPHAVTDQGIRIHGDYTSGSYGPQDSPIFYYAVKFLGDFSESNIEVAARKGVDHVLKFDSSNNRRTLDGLGSLHRLRLGLDEHLVLGFEAPTRLERGWMAIRRTPSGSSPLQARVSSTRVIQLSGTSALSSIAGYRIEFYAEQLPSGDVGYLFFLPR